MQTKLKVAVLGVGSLGKEHARIYSGLAAAGQIEFAGVHDVSASAAARIAEKYRVPVFASLDEALSGAEAFSVVTPTRTTLNWPRCLWPPANICWWKSR